MFVVVLCIVAKTWKQLRGFSVGKWTNKLWCVHAIEYYTALKRNDLLNHKKTQRNLRC